MGGPARGLRIKMNEKYDTIGVMYNSYRNADTRIVNNLKGLLELPEGATILDVGAGTGNYTNALAASGYQLKAVEPSDVMQRQMVPHSGVEWFTGTAASIPLPDASVDGVISILAVHHFPDLALAAEEMWRVGGTGPMVLFTIDPEKGESFWFKEYFPGIYRHLFDAFVPVERLIAVFGGGRDTVASIHAFPLPCDFSDLNMHTGWNRPEIYFNPDIRRSMSGFAMADPNEVEKGLGQLRRDLETGQWDKNNAHLRTTNSRDLGFVFVKIQACKPGVS